ncbi:hypothetical protein [uncultured Thiohalocapsa sp.]|uniref:hypothetical protein n=1 Tax=uncultured Thiohalocapsa sp. TaxID=768990 RepID=UPI0025CD2F35|nr:hypothetical protein [uncultured Thiohalocapsa sp.]
MLLIPCRLFARRSRAAMHRLSQEHRLLLVLFLSGSAGLGYEMVWTRMLAVGPGHEIVAVLAVIAAFFAALALGAYAGLVDGPRRAGCWSDCCRAVGRCPEPGPFAAAWRFA